MTDHGADTDRHAMLDALAEPFTVSSSLSRDEAFDLLSNPRRLCAVRHLARRRRCTMDDLVEHVATREYGTDRSALTREQRRRIYVSLHQSHLPRLAGADLVIYDPDRRTIRYRPNRSLEGILENGRSATGRYERWYGYATACSIVAAVVSYAWIAPGASASLPLLFGPLSIGLVALLEYGDDEPGTRSLAGRLRDSSAPES